MSKSGAINVKIPSQFVPVLRDKCFRKSSKVILALRMGSFFERGLRVIFFHSWERFSCISILNSLPSTSILHHMNMWDRSGTMTTYHPFWVSSNCCSPLILLHNFVSRQSLTLSEHLTVSECGDLLRFPINSKYQFSSWSTEPIDDQTKWHSLTTWIAENGSSGFAITSTIEERGWMRMEGYHTKNKSCGGYFRCQIAAWIGTSNRLNLSHFTPSGYL